MDGDRPAPLIRRRLQSKHASDSDQAGGVAERRQCQRQFAFALHQTARGDTEIERQFLLLHLARTFRQRDEHLPSFATDLSRGQRQSQIVLAASASSPAGWASPASSAVSG